MNLFPVSNQSSELVLPQSESSANLTSKQSKNWSDHIIGSLNTLDTKIDEWIPDNVLQEKIDKFAGQIKENFSSLKGFDEWLQKNNAIEWYSQLATYLIKLPPKAAWNIVKAIYGIFSQALYMAVHPIKGLNSLVKTIVFLLNELTKAETWAKMGAGSIGILTGQGIILGGPISLIGLGIGGALIAAGFSIDSISAALGAKKGKGLVAIQNKIKTYAKQLPESYLTALFTGLLIGGIKRAFTKPTAQPLEEISEAQKTNIEKVEKIVETTGAPIELSSYEQFLELINKRIPIVFKIYANWCGPCNKLAPVMKDLAEKYLGKIQFVNINIDQFKNIAADYNITSIPSALIYDNSSLITKAVGGDNILNAVKNLAK